jgi:Leucine Rich repeat
VDHRSIHQPKRAYFCARTIVDPISPPSIVAASRRGSNQSITNMTVTAFSGSDRRLLPTQAPASQQSKQQRLGNAAAAPPPSPPLYCCADCCCCDGGERCWSSDLDLRQYGAITEQDLRRLPHRVTRLWIGPYFDPSTLHQASVVVRALIVAMTPTTATTTTVLHEHYASQNQQQQQYRLQTLDLDLTKLPFHNATERDDTVAAVFGRFSAVTELGLHLHPVAFDDPTEYPADTTEDHSLRRPGDGTALAVANAMLVSPTMVPHLDCLDLSRNAIGDLGVQALVSALLLSLSTQQQKQRPSSLRALNLSHNALSDSACQSLSVLLDMYPSLEQLDLSYNTDVTAAGLDVLVQALRSNTSLRRIALQGCSILYYDDDDSSNDDDDAGATTAVWKLVQCLEHNNMTLESVQLLLLPQGRRMTTISQQPSPPPPVLAHWLELNRLGRRIVRLPHRTVLLPHLLERAAAGGGGRRTKNSSQNSNNSSSSISNLYSLLKSTVTDWAY